jgi:hypothetical protein
MIYRSSSKTDKCDPTIFNSKVSNQGQIVALMTTKDNQVFGFHMT